MMAIHSRMVSSAKSKTNRVCAGSFSFKCPQQESNLRLCLRRATLYPLSYGGNTCVHFSSKNRRKQARERSNTQPLTLENDGQNLVTCACL